MDKIYLYKLLRNTSEFNNLNFLRILNLVIINLHRAVPIVILINNLYFNQPMYQQTKYYGNKLL